MGKEYGQNEEGLLGVFSSQESAWRKVEGESRIWWQWMNRKAGQVISYLNIPVIKSSWQGGVGKMIDVVGSRDLNLDRRIPSSCRKISG